VVPRLWQTELHSVALANTHFWLALVGQLTYNITMWIAGIQQGAMLKSMEPDGTLTYTFVETVTRIVPYWQMRTAGGVIFFVGVLIFTYNIAMTIRGSGKEIAAEEAYA
jgi:cytochrome c oxidase cbb3-type subunit 1